MQEERRDLLEVIEAMMQKHGLNTILLLGHINADGDCAGSVLGLAHYLADTTDYKIVPHLTEKTDLGVKQYVERDKVFRPFEKPELPDRYLAVACDTAILARMAGLEYYQKATAKIAVDHHRRNEMYAEENLVSFYESCSEYIFTMLEAANCKAGEEPNSANYFYLGILHDTECFKRVGENTFAAAEKLMKLGVNHKKLVKTLHAYSYDFRLRNDDILRRAKRAMNGKIAYIYLTGEECEKNGYTFEDIHPISGILRDCSDIEVGFTMFEEEPGLYRFSFRSDGEFLDVNQLTMAFGGGGHKGASAIRTRCDNPEKLLADILEKISEMTGEPL